MTQKVERMLGGASMKTRRTRHSTHQALDTVLPLCINRLKENTAWQLEQLEAKVKWYEEQIRLGKQKQYGASSEKTPAEQLQFTAKPILSNELR